MSNSCAIRQQVAYSIYQVSSSSCPTRAFRKASFFMKNIGEFSGEKWQNSRPPVEKKKEKKTKSKRTRQKNKRVETKENQMTAMRFQTGGSHQTSPAPLWGLNSPSGQKCWKAKFLVAGEGLQTVMSPLQGEKERLEWLVTTITNGPRLQC